MSVNGRQTLSDSITVKESNKQAVDGIKQDLINNCNSIQLKVCVGKFHVEDSRTENNVAVCSTAIREVKKLHSDNFENSTNSTNVKVDIVNKITRNTMFKLSEANKRVSNQNKQSNSFEISSESDSDCVKQDSCGSIDSHVCKYCCKSFLCRNQLIDHVKTHTGEKPYSCPICNKKCSLSGNLIKHMRTHTGDKPYSCSVCSKQFSESNWNWKEIYFRQLKQIQ